MSRFMHYGKQKQRQHQSGHKRLSFTHLVKVEDKGKKQLLYCLFCLFLELKLCHKISAEAGGEMTS